MHGYAEFLEAVSDSTHPEHASMLQWVGGTYDQDMFNPTAVVFEDPRKRWKIAFENYKSFRFRGLRWKSPYSLDLRESR